MAKDKAVGDMNVAELADAVDMFDSQLEAIQHQRDALHDQAMSLHEARKAYEGELVRRADVMGKTVPRLVLDARKISSIEE